MTTPGQPLLVEGRRGTPVLSHLPKMLRAAMILLALPLGTLGCHGDEARWEDYFVAAGSAAVDAVADELYPERVGAERNRERVLEGFDDGRPRYVVLGADGDAMARALVGVPPDIAEVPYWGSWVRTLGAHSDGRVLAAVNLKYRILMYTSDGLLIDSIVEPPKSWHQAPAPDQGAFANDSGGARKYLQSISVLTGLHSVEDSILVVAHGRMVTQETDGPSLVGREEVPANRSIAQTRRADLYINFRRVATDVPVPGEIVGSTRTGLLLVKRGESGDADILVDYRWRGEH